MENQMQNAENNYFVHILQHIYCWKCSIDPTTDKVTNAGLLQDTACLLPFISAPPPIPAFGKLILWKSHSQFLFLHTLRTKTVVV